MTPSVAQTVYRSVVPRLVSSELEVMWKEAIQALFEE
jgi:hypothetical protein